MRERVLILGGAGNFGKRIAMALTGADIPVILAGRTEGKCLTLQNQLPTGMSEVACFDANQELDEQLSKLNPKLVINTCGPFQNSTYAIAETCIHHKTHYIDLADGRDFVIGINRLDQAAKQARIAVISGASTVPGLSSAVIEYFKSEFSKFRSLRYGISPGQKAERGLATTQGILSYVGQKLNSFPGTGVAYGWQDVYRQRYPELGNRWMANCDIPDLDLFPARYGLQKIQFSAGLELSALHLGLWGLSWLVRAGVPIRLTRYAPLLLQLSNLFDRLGSADGGMHMTITGLDHAGKLMNLDWFMIAKDGDGPHIPTVPAILLAKQIMRDEFKTLGAMACVGLVSLDDCLKELSNRNIRTHIVRS